MPRSLFKVDIRNFPNTIGQLLQVKKCYLQKTTCSTLIIETNKYEYIKNYFMISILGNERYQALVGVEH